MNDLQEYSFTQAAKIFRMRTSSFIKEYISSGKLAFVVRGSSKHVLHRDLFELQELEKVRI